LNEQKVKQNSPGILQCRDCGLSKSKIQTQLHPVPEALVTLP
jgi:hypothetical protein